MAAHLGLFLRSDQRTRAGALRCLHDGHISLEILSIACLCLFDPTTFAASGRCERNRRGTEEKAGRILAGDDRSSGAESFRGCEQSDGRLQSDQKYLHVASSTPRSIAKRKRCRFKTPAPSTSRGEFS